MAQQNLTIKLQIRIDPATNERLERACKEWAPKGETYTPSEVVRLLLDERLPRTVKAPKAPVDFRTLAERLRP
jgi:hypothetical protein